jgi:predicted nucleic acid-binding protein
LIFADTSFFVALSMPWDAHHSTATELLTTHGETRIITSNQVRGETWTTLRRKLDHREAVMFLDRLASSRIEIACVGASLEDEAVEWLRRHDEREYSFVDATSFAFMRANGITEALAFDGDFAAAGFVELRP